MNESLCYQDNTINRKVCGGENHVENKAKKHSHVTQLHKFMYLSLCAIFCYPWCQLIANFGKSVNHKQEPTFILAHCHRNMTL